MKRINAFLLMTAVLCVSGIQGTNAYEAAYQCVVKDAKQLADDGTLESLDDYLGAEFVVDRATGRMNGRLKNHGYFGEPTVIDPGSKDQAFKVITVHDAGFPAVDYLYVGSFAEGYEKPFLYIDGNKVFSGACKPY
ncbi:hypothetical protein N9359_04445 [Luminiphilus sp.]|nr:hypothetical protein [Luminiphilus sp.]